MKSTIMRKLSLRRPSRSQSPDESKRDTLQHRHTLGGYSPLNETILPSVGAGFSSMGFQEYVAKYAPETER